MKTMFFLFLMIPSIAFSVCCNHGGQVVNGQPMQTQEGCLTQANLNAGHYWVSGSTCPQSGSCCKVKIVNGLQGVFQDCAQLQADLSGMSGADMVGRCNQINGGQSCQWTCSPNSQKPIKRK